MGGRIRVYDPDGHRHVLCRVSKSYGRMLLIDEGVLLYPAEDTLLILETNLGRYQ